MKKPLPTDLEILDVIYERYYDEFAGPTYGAGTKDRKIYVAIDIVAVAKALRVDDDIVFGRLYYHLEHRHGYQEEQIVTSFGSNGKEEERYTISTHFFKKDGPMKGSVNFPLLASVLADLRAEDERHKRADQQAFWALMASLLAVGVAFIALFVK